MEDGHRPLLVEREYVRAQGWVNLGLRLPCSLSRHLHLHPLLPVLPVLLVVILVVVMLLVLLLEPAE